MVKSSSRSRSRSRSQSRSRSHSRRASRATKRSRRTTNTRRSPGKKGYKVIADNIDMLPKSLQVAYCKSCSTRPHEMTPLVVSKSKLVRMLNRKAYCIMGPCSGCGRMRSCFVKKPAGY